VLVPSPPQYGLARLMCVSLSKPINCQVATQWREKETQRGELSLERGDARVGGVQFRL
jgi:hypothetical protein